MSEQKAEEVAPETEVADIETLKKGLAEEKSKAERYLANWQRSEADLINFKRYSEQEREEIKLSSTASLVLSLLPFLDDLQSAFNVVPPKLHATGWVEGIRLANHKLDIILEQQGLAPIKALGEPFDPRFHEAVGQSKGADGVVVQEVQKGYTFRGRVIRPSRVLVGSGEEA